MSIQLWLDTSFRPISDEIDIMCIKLNVPQCIISFNSVGLSQLYQFSTKLVMSEQCNACFLYQKFVIFIRFNPFHDFFGFPLNSEFIFIEFLDKSTYIYILNVITSPFSGTELAHFFATLYKFAKSLCFFIQDLWPFVASWYIPANPLK